MGCRANNIMFNKQTTALGFCNKNRSRFGHNQSLLLPLLLPVLLFILLRVKILFLIIYTFLYESFFFCLCCCCCFRSFVCVCRSINFYIGPFYCWMREKKTAEYDKNTPYTRWFYVDQPNRTNINFENMIIIHGYCIQTIHFLFPCLFSCSCPRPLTVITVVVGFVVHSTSFFLLYFISFFSFSVALRVI